MGKERNRGTSPHHCVNPWGVHNSNTAHIWVPPSTRKGFNRCGRATVGIGIRHGFQTWKSRNPQFSQKRCSSCGTGEELQDHRWPWEGERDQPFTDMKQGVSTGIREQLLQNQHREATGCLAGAKDLGQTHLWGDKNTTTSTHRPPPNSKY